MKQQTFLATCAVIAAAAITLAAGLWMLLGSAWFSFYGWANVLLVSVIAFSVALWKRYRSKRFSRWPILLFAIPGIAISVVQIGFWTVFFSTGSQGLPLGFARALMRPFLDPALVMMTVLLASYALWLFLRAASTHCAPRKTAQ